MNLKPFHTYRDGLPPGPGIFANNDSIDRHGIALQIGDIIEDHAQGTRGLVIAIAGDMLVYLVSQPDENGELDWFMGASAEDVTIVGQVSNVLAEVARIEAAGDAIDAERVKATAGGSMESADLLTAVDDLLQQASWCERVPEMLAAGNGDIVEYVQAEGMPAGEPYELISQAIALLVAERRRYIVRVLASGAVFNAC